MLFLQKSNTRYRLEKHGNPKKVFEHFGQNPAKKKNRDLLQTSKKINQGHQKSPDYGVSTVYRKIKTFQGKLKNTEDYPLYFIFAFF